MNNLSSYSGLVDAKIRASDKDLPVTVKLKSELILIKFLYFINVIADTKPIWFTQKILSKCEPQKEAKFERHPLPAFGSFCFSPGISLTQGQGVALAREKLAGSIDGVGQF